MLTFNLCFKQQGTTGSTGDFVISVGRMKGTPGTAVLLPEIPISDSEVEGGTDITPILTNLTVGNVYDVYVGMYVNEENKLGFTAKVIDTGTHSNHTTKALLFMSTLGTGCGFAICCRTDENTVTKLCVPNFTTTGIGIDALADEEIMSMSDLKRVLGIFRTSYQTKETSLYRRGMWLIDTAFLVNIYKDESGNIPVWKSAVPFVMSYAQYNCSIRQSYMNLRSFWNWYSFLTGEFYLPVQYVETSNDKKIYISTPITPPDDEMVFYDSALYPFQDNLAADGQPAVAWDYQSGTDILSLISAPGQSLTLKSGAILQLIRETHPSDGVDRYYYFVQISNTEDDTTYKIKTAFNTDAQIGDMVTGDYVTANHNNRYRLDGDSDYDLGVNNPYFNSAYDTILLRGIYLVETPYDEDGIGNYAMENIDQPASFFNKYPTTPLAFAGVYTSRFYTNYKGESSSKRAEEWGFDNTIADIMVCNVGGYVSQSSGNQSYRQVLNLFSNCKPSQTISTFSYGGEMKVDGVEGFTSLFGIVGRIAPEDPEQGENSIGGGGGGTHTGGHGTFNDNGDNVLAGHLGGVALSNTLVNWYIGDLDSTAMQANLILLGHWLQAYEKPSVLPLDDFNYKYSDKLANICSLKCMYSPIAPTLAAQQRITIHEQEIKDVGDPTGAIGRRVTSQFGHGNIVSEFILPEYFGSFLDYEPYTTVKIYLPFAGIHEINTADVMNKKISINASVDFITGDIVYNIVVDTGTVKSVLYTFSGNCAVDLPLTATDYSGKVMTTIQTVLGGATVAAGAMSLAPVYGAGAIAAGALAMGTGLLNYHMGAGKGKTVSRGSVGGNIGAMSPLKCYLIVTRPKKVEAKEYGKIYGYPCMKSYMLGDLQGYVKVANCNWKIPGATEEEIDEIDRLLTTEGAIL